MLRRDGPTLKRKTSSRGSSTECMSPSPTASPRDDADPIVESPDGKFTFTGGVGSELPGGVYWARSKQAFIVKATRHPEGSTTAPKSFGVRKRFFTNRDAAIEEVETQKARALHFFETGTVLKNTHPRWDVDSEDE